MAELLKGERKGCPVEGGGEIPAFTMGELSEFTPEEMLSEVRDFHSSRGQWGLLRRIDEGVERDGNPYRGKPLTFPEA